jgi:nucleoporin POM152
VQYEVRHKPFQGSSAISRKEFDAALSKAAISMDTLKAGDYTYKFSALADNLYNSDKNFSPLIIQQRVNAKPSAVFTKPGQSFKYCMEEQEQEDKIPLTLTGVPPFYVEVEIKHQAGSPPETYRIPSIDSNSYGMRIPRQHLRLGTQQVRVRTVRDARGCQRKYEISGPSVQIQLFEAPSIYPLESRRDYCVGERIAYTLSGTPPFDITYDFNGKWNAKSQTTNFRRIAEKPGEFTITSISDKASECRAAVNIPKTIHPMPSVQISRGKQSRVDIHEGNEVDILFEFWGTPPFEFTYTRSTNAKKGQRSSVLETRHDVSYEHSKVVKASQEGTYEVVAIKDKYCSFSTLQVEKSEKR